MSIEKDISSDDATFIAVLKLEIGGAIRQTREVLICAYDLEEAEKGLKQSATRLPGTGPQIA